MVNQQRLIAELNAPALSKKTDSIKCINNLMPHHAYIRGSIYIVCTAWAPEEVQQGGN